MATPRGPRPARVATDVGFDPVTGAIEIGAGIESGTVGLADVLRRAHHILLSARPARSASPGTGVSGQFETLRWFDLPRDCLLPERGEG